MIRFAEADPSDAKVMMKIQTELKVSIRFEQYLYELIQRGREILSAQQ